MEEFREQSDGKPARRMSEESISLFIRRMRVVRQSEDRLSALIQSLSDEPIIVIAACFNEKMLARFADRES